MKESLPSIADRAIKIATKNNVRQVAREVWYMLLRQKKLSSIEKFIEIMEERSSLSQGRIRANVTSAQRLQNTEIDEIRTNLEKVYQSPVDVSTEIESNILGGLKIKIADDVIDLSWRGKLNSLKIKLGVG